MLAFGLPFPVALLLGAALSGGVALLVAAPASRLQGDYLVVGSLAFAVICYDLMMNMTGVTRGPMGLPGSPSPSILGVAFDTPWRLLLVIVLLLILVGAVAGRIAFWRYSRVL